MVHLMTVGGSPPTTVWDVHPLPATGCLPPCDKARLICKDPAFDEPVTDVHSDKHGFHEILPPRGGPWPPVTTRSRWNGLTLLGGCR